MFIVHFKLVPGVVLVLQTRPKVLLDWPTWSKTWSCLPDWATRYPSKLKRSWSTGHDVDGKSTAFKPQTQQLILDWLNSQLP